jgi:hypothetical protein
MYYKSNPITLHLQTIHIILIKYRQRSHVPHPSIYPIYENVCKWYVPLQSVAFFKKPDCSVHGPIRHSNKCFLTSRNRYDVRSYPCQIWTQVDYLSSEKWTIIYKKKKKMSHFFGKRFVSLFFSQTEWATCLQIWHGYGRTSYLLHDIKNPLFSWMCSRFSYVPLQSVTFSKNLIVAIMVPFDIQTHVFQYHPTDTTCVHILVKFGRRLTISVLRNRPFFTKKKKIEPFLWKTFCFSFFLTNWMENLRSKVTRIWTYIVSIAWYQERLVSLDELTFFVLFTPIGRFFQTYCSVHGPIRHSNACLLRNMSTLILQVE